MLMRVLEEDKKDVKRHSKRIPAAGVNEASRRYMKQYTKY
jgi:hypothetical protein